MDQTSQAAAILVPIAAAGGVIGMLTILARASRTVVPAVSRRPRPDAAPPESNLVGQDAVEQPAAATEGALVKQRGIPTSV